MISPLEPFQLEYDDKDLYLGGANPAKGSISGTITVPAQFQTYYLRLQMFWDEPGETDPFLQEDLHPDTQGRIHYTYANLGDGVYEITLLAIDPVDAQHVVRSPFPGGPLTVLVDDPAYQHLTGIDWTIADANPLNLIGGRLVLDPEPVPVEGSDRWPAQAVLYNRQPGPGVTPFRTQTLGPRVHGRPDRRFQIPYLPNGDYWVVVTVNEYDDADPTNDTVIEAIPNFTGAIPVRINTETGLGQTVDALPFYYWIFNPQTGNFSGRVYFDAAFADLPIYVGLFDSLPSPTEEPPRRVALLERQEVSGVGVGSFFYAQLPLVREFFPIAFVDVRADGDPSNDIRVPKTSSGAMNFRDPGTNLTDYHFYLGVVPPATQGRITGRVYLPATLMDQEPRVFAYLGGEQGQQITATLYDRDDDTSSYAYVLERLIAGDYRVYAYADLLGNGYFSTLETTEPYHLGTLTVEPDQPATQWYENIDLYYRAPNPDTGSISGSVTLPVEYRSMVHTTVACTTEPFDPAELRAGHVPPQEQIAGLQLMAELAPGDDAAGIRRFLYLGDLEPGTYYCCFVFDPCASFDYTQMTYLLYPGNPITVGEGQNVMGVDYTVPSGSMLPCE